MTPREKIKGPFQMTPQDEIKGPSLPTDTPRRNFYPATNLLVVSIYTQQ